MGDNSEPTKPLHVIVPVAAYDGLQTVAKRRRQTLSDVVRVALEKELRSEGINVAVTVQHGGDRMSGRD